jgi:hypothetical protein
MNKDSKALKRSSLIISYSNTKPLITTLIAQIMYKNIKIFKYLSSILKSMRNIEVGIIIKSPINCRILQTT